MQTIIAPASRLNLRLSSFSGSGKNKHGAHAGGAEMVTTSSKPRTDPSRHHPYPHRDDDDGAVAAKLAYTACLAALQTLTTYLSKEVGIQLQLRPDEENVLQMLQRAHDYMHQLDPGHENATSLVLLLGCWQSVYNYTAVSHHISWRQFQRYKHFAAPGGTTGHHQYAAEATTTTTTTTTPGKTTTGTTTTTAGGENHHKFQHHPAHTTTHYNKTNANATTMLDQVLQQTIRYAEGCSTCQRQILLLQRKCREYHPWPLQHPSHKQPSHQPPHGQEEEDVEVDGR
jgi:hypothetical protein